MKFTSFRDTRSLYIGSCADRVLQTWGLDESTLLERRGEGRACALTVGQVGRRTDNSVFSYEQIAA